MTEENASRFVVLFCAGLGLLLAGGANLLLGRARRGVRAAATLLAVGGAVLAAGSLHAPSAGPVAAWLAAGVAVCLIAGSDALRRPAGRWGAAVAVGVTVLIGSVARHDQLDAEATRQGLDDLEAMCGLPPSAQVTALTVTTDRGTPIQLMAVTDPRGASELAPLEARFTHHILGRDLLRREPGSDRANCHGWVFTGGRFWVACTTVPVILVENGYELVTDPKPGDLAIYGDGTMAQHTALVRYVSAGMPPMVEGKWGPGPVFMHSADVPCYGGVTGYYRSPRRGHLLKGIPAE